MMARGFKPVGWVAGVAAAALGCYMLSLNVAAERAELKKLEWRIVMAKREIRTLQTELGTRGRLAQLENWNANVLALSAPTTDQFIDSEVTLARFDQREKTIEEKVPVQMASAEIPAPAPKIQAPVHLASAPAAVSRVPTLVHRASVVLPEAQPLKEAAAATSVAQPKKIVADAKPSVGTKPKLVAAKPAAPARKKAPAIDDSLVKEIRAAAQAEGKGSDGGR